MSLFSVKAVAFVYDAYVLIFHIALHFIITKEKVGILEYLNTLSIFLYLMIFAFFIFDKLKSIYIITILEIVTFGFIANFCLGRELLFYTYSIAVMPIMIVYVYHERCILGKKNKVFLYTCLSILALSILFFLECTILGNKASITLSDQGYLYLFYLNSLNIISAVIFGSVLFLIIAIAMHDKYAKLINENSYLAMHDPLTGISNRNALNVEIGMLREKEEKFGLIIADIDDFKHINDTYGHDCGDYVLRKIAEILSLYTKDNFKLYRFGGEEMIFVYYGNVEVLSRSENMKKHISTYNFTYNKQKIKVTMTFGVSRCGNDFEKLLKEADDKLYKGKNSGKNKVVYN